MNAPITADIRRDAARSLVERLREKTSLVRLFRYNSAMKHGVPIDSPEDNGYSSSSSSTSETIHTVQPSSSTNQSTGKTDWVKNAALGAVALAVPFAGGYALSQYTGGDKGETTVNKVEDPKVVNPPPSKPMKYRESPYQFLEDEGEHMP
jgi:hypothetical protein